MRGQLAALFLFCVIDTLGFGILIPLVPYMADRFGTAPAFITPILGSYSLCQLLAAPLWGRLSDRYGRRRVFTLGAALFTFASLLCAVAPSAALLVAARLLQGVGGALLTPGSLAMSEPVAMTTLLASSRCLSPLPSATPTRPGPRMVALP